MLPPFICSSSARVPGLSDHLTGTVQIHPTPAFPSWVPDWSDTGRAPIPLSPFLAQTRPSTAGNSPVFLGGPNAEGIQLFGSYLGHVIELGAVYDTEQAHRGFVFSFLSALTHGEDRRLSVLDRWIRQLHLDTVSRTTWSDFINVATCGAARSPLYRREASMSILAHYHHDRGPHRVH